MIVKKINKPFKHALGLSILLAMSSTTFAEIATTSLPPESGYANLSWSTEEAASFLNDNEQQQINTENADSINQVSTNLSTDHNTLTASEKSALQPIGNTLTVTSQPTTTILNNSTVNQHSAPSLISNSTFANQPSVNARAALVMDAETGQVLYSKNTNTALPIASITKLMTAVVIADARLKMDETITLQSIDFAGAGGKNSSSTLRVGDKMNRAEALLFALMKSENPAAAALARTYPGGRSAFVAAMNQKADDLGMNSSRFTESTGLDRRNIASARDLGILVKASSQYELIRQFSTTPSYNFNLGYRVLKSNNTNALVRNGGWNINISKTGFINEAGRCVAMHTTLNNRPAVVVLLGASTSAVRTNDATRLMNWVSNLPKNI